VVSKRLDDPTVRIIRDALLNMHNDEEGRKILRTMGISGYTYLEPKHYKVIANMIEHISKSR